MSWKPLKHVRQTLQPGIASACLCALTVAGCGGDDAPATSVRLDAASDGSLRFERSATATQAGRARIAMANPSDIPHAIGIRGGGVQEIGETAGKDKTSSVETNLAAGRYTLFCPVGGHEGAGMVATLTVR